MSTVKARLAISVDGFVAGPDQSEDDPLGKGGKRLHEWVFATRAFAEAHGGGEGGEDNVDSKIYGSTMDGIGAHVMGRNMFGPIRGEWDRPWDGWWGDEPPYHAPVFVLTHHPREPLVMQGGTTFTFVTDGFDSALAQARQAAGDQDVAIAGGASTVRQALAAGALDELLLHVSPVVLGSGERLLDGLDPLPTLEQVAVVPSTTVTHITYRVER